MNILVISHLFPSKDRPYYGTFVLHQVRELKALGNKVIVLSPQPFIPKWIPTKILRWKIIQNLPENESIDGIEVRFKKCFVIPKILLRYRGRIYYFWLRKWIKLIVVKYNIQLIHCHTILPDGDIGSIIKMSMKIPLVITVHGADLYSISKSYKNRKRIIKVLCKADAIILVSHQFKKYLQNIIPDFNIMPEIKVIHNGIQVYDNYPDPDWLGFNNSVKILTISSLIKRKKIDLVLKAIHDLRLKHSNVKYFIIGDGWDKKKFVDLSKSLGLKDDVFFLYRHSSFLIW